MSMMRQYLLCLSLVALCVSSCQGDRSTEPPIMPIQNMVEQTSYGPQMPNTFFSDKRAVRPPLEHTIAQGEEQLETPYYTGKEARSDSKNPVWVTNFPLKLDKNILLDGQKNFNIYCSSCHGLSGHNDGLVTKRSGGSIRPADIHSADIISRPVGKLYDAVTNGVNNWNMPGFSAQLDPLERWGIVAYVRALQLSEQGTPLQIQKGKKDK